AVPRLGAAGVPPALDRFQDGLAPVAAEVVVDVDDEQGRAVAEAGARAVARGREHELVTLGQEPVPDGLGHDRAPVAARSISSLAPAWMKGKKLVMATRTPSRV